MADTTDRELLELAARAAGIMKHPDGRYWAGHWWSPLDDDGDCARMEAACGIDIEWLLDDVFATVTINADTAYHFSERYVHHSGDRNAARRHASVRAAAHLGEGMKK